jgi:hypothetical protein
VANDVVATVEIEAERDEPPAQPRPRICREPAVPSSGLISDDGAFLISACGNRSLTTSYTAGPNGLSPITSTVGYPPSLDSRMSTAGIAAMRSAMYLPGYGAFFDCTVHCAEMILGALR